MDAQRKQDDGYKPAATVWSGTHHRPGAPEEGAESDVPEGEPEATRAEEREAIEHTPDYPSGHRGDLGDSGPGED